MKTASLSALALASLLALAGMACSVSPETDGDASSTGSAQSTHDIQYGKTRSFSGTFVLGRGDTYAFEVSDIDWDAKTARFSATLGSSAAASNRPMTVSLARCPGCFRFDMGEDFVQVSNGKLAAIRFDGSDASSTRFTEARSDAPAAASCTLTCGGQTLECVEGGTQAECKPERFSVLPRCPYEVTFASRSCSPPPPAPSDTGSCSLVCGGDVLDCHEGVAAADCKADLFSAIPRCPHSFEFAAAGRCGR